MCFMVDLRPRGWCDRATRSQRLSSAVIIAVAETICDVNLLFLLSMLAFRLMSFELPKLLLYTTCYKLLATNQNRLLQNYWRQ